LRQPSVADDDVDAFARCGHFHGRNGGACSGCQQRP
jgi:hypothetical protein